MGAKISCKTSSNIPMTGSATTGQDAEGVRGGAGEEAEQGAGGACGFAISIYIQS